MSKRIVILFASVLGLTTLGVGVAGACALDGMPRPPFAMGPEAHKAMMEQMVDHALDVALATDAQSDQVHAILDEAAPRFDAVHEGMKAHHERVREALTAATIDRDELETLRQEAVTGFGQASEIVADVAGDVAEVLTQEQRVKLADFAESMHPE